MESDFENTTIKNIEFQNKSYHYQFWFIFILILLMLPQSILIAYNHQ